MEIDHDRLEGAVPEVGGDLAHRSATLQHVGGVAVAQGVDTELLMSARQTALRLGDFDGGPDTGLGHGVIGAVKRLAQGDARTLPSASGAGEKPLGIAMGLPESPEPVEQLRSDGHLALLATLAVDHPDDEAFAIDVLGLEVERLAHA